MSLSKLDFRVVENVQITAVNHGTFIFLVNRIVKIKHVCAD